MLDSRITRYSRCSACSCTRSLVQRNRRGRIVRSRIKNIGWWWYRGKISVNVRRRSPKKGNIHSRMTKDRIFGNWERRESLGTRSFRSKFSLRCLKIARHKSKHLFHPSPVPSCPPGSRLLFKRAIRKFKLESRPARPFAFE